MVNLTRVGSIWTTGGKTHNDLNSMNTVQQWNIKSTCIPFDESQLHLLGQGNRVTAVKIKQSVRTLVMLLTVLNSGKILIPGTDHSCLAFSEIIKRFTYYFPYPFTVQFHFNTSLRNDLMYASVSGIAQDTCQEIQEITRVQQH